MNPPPEWPAMKQEIEAALAAPGVSGFTLSEVEAVLQRKRRELAAVNWQIEARHAGEKTD